MIFIKLMSNVNKIQFYTHLLFFRLNFIITIVIYLLIIFLYNGFSVPCVEAEALEPKQIENNKNVIYYVIGGTLVIGTIIAIIYFSGGFDPGSDIYGTLLGYFYAREDETEIIDHLSIGRQSYDIFDHGFRIGEEKTVLFITRSDLVRAFFDHDTKIRDVYQQIFELLHSKNLLDQRAFTIMQELHMRSVPPLDFYNQIYLNDIIAQAPFLT